jgi:hypothetical protein
MPKKKPAEGVVKIICPTTEILAVELLPVNRQASAVASVPVTSNRYQPFALVASISVAEVSPNCVTEP